LSDLVMLRLFGRTSTSVSMASGTGLFNHRHRTWDAYLLSFLNIDPKQLPDIANDDEFYSDLNSEYADRWPQLRQARWYGATGDGAANNIGAGCVTQERAALMIGTSGAMRVMWRGDIPETLPPELWCYRADEERVIVGGALSDGGGLFAWMKSALNIKGSNEEIERELGSMQPDVHGLTVLPFWFGERSTGWHSTARGTIAGLSQDTRPIEILRASMEAIAYRFAFIAASMDRVAPQTAIVASGNALASSQVWTQILSDVLGRPITISDVREASSRGAVLLALEMEGRIRDIVDVPVSIARTIEPDMARHARYREGLLRHEKLYTLLIDEA
jgi:gluconokinase